MDRLYSAVEQFKAIITSKPPKFSAIAREDSDTRLSHVWKTILEYIWDISDGDEQFKQAVHDYAVTGLYVLDSNVWNIIRELKPSERGELEIVDVINWYVDRGRTGYSELEGFWSDAGTPDSLVQANKLVSEKEKK